jgi:AcrR family transcriptional regulator
MPRNLKDHILQTASALFYSQGIKATGVDTIVKAAGTTKMSLYKYFPSKDDLILAHLQKSRAEMRIRIVDAIESRATQPKQKLLAIFDVFAELLSTPEFRGCPFINASAEFAEEANPVQEASAEFYDGFHKLLSNLAQQADVENPELVSKQLLMLIAGAIVTEQMKRQSGAMAIARQAAERLLD